MAQIKIGNHEVDQNKGHMKRDNDYKLDNKPDSEGEQISVENRNITVSDTIHAVYYLFGMLEILLAMRVILQFFGASSDDVIANIVYNLSNPFVALFVRLLRNPTLSSTSVIEITTLIAMVTFAILAWLLGRVMRLAESRPHGNDRTYI